MLKTFLGVSRARITANPFVLQELGLLLLHHACLSKMVYLKGLACLGILCSPTPGSMFSLLCSGMLVALFYNWWALMCLQDGLMCRTLRVKTKICPGHYLDPPFNGFNVFIDLHALVVRTGAQTRVPCLFPPGICRSNAGCSNFRAGAVWVCGLGRPTRIFR